MSRSWVLGAAVIIGCTGTQRAFADAPLVEKYLHEGKLADGEKALQAELRQHPNDDQARFGLGALQFVRSVERLGQSLYRYGVLSDRGQQLGIPILRLPVPVNPEPQQVAYNDIRRMIRDLIDDLGKAEKTLAEVKDDNVKLPLHVGLIRLDFAGNGNASDPLKKIIARYMSGTPNAEAAKSENKDWLVKFDRGDVAWLRGYCHLLMALAETALAYDGKELFDHTAHLFFAKVDSPFKFLANEETTPFGINGVNILDVIAFIHLIRLPVKEAPRMKSALAHLEQALALSKESWKFIMAETDDDHEWIPNPRQKGVLGMTVSQDMIDGWLAFVDEAEALLAGKRLAPFWRGKDKRGLNLHKFFTEPRTLDLVLWVQGTAALPYLEEGPMTRPEVWGRLERVFAGNFMGFAIWFN